MRHTDDHKKKNVQGRMKFHSTAINLQCKLLWRRMGEGEGNPTLHFLLTKSKPKEKQSCQEVDYYGVGDVCVQPIKPQNTMN